eukprot:246804_1
MYTYNGTYMETTQPPVLRRNCNRYIPSLVRMNNGTHLNLEVQISDTPYYDDCSPQGWKLAQTLDDEYNIGLHGIYGEDELVHYNHEATCLNWYNSTIATKTWYYMGRSSFSFDSDWIQSRKRVD